MKHEEIERASWKKNAVVCLILCLVCCFATLLFSACGKNGDQETGAVRTSGSPDSEQIYYHFQETALPSYEGIPNVFEQKYTTSGNILGSCGDTFYRFLQFSTTEEPFRQKNYVQILKPPYQEWETEEAGSCGDVPVSILGETEGKLVLLLCGEVQGEDQQKGQEDQADRENQKDQETQKSQTDQETQEDDGPCTYYLAFWQPGSADLERVPDSGYEGEKGEFSADGEFFLTSEGEAVYFDFWKQGTVTVFDEQFHLKEEKNLGEEVQVSGILQDPESGRLLWYGVKDQQAGVWDLENGTPMLKDGQTLEKVNPGNFRGVYDEEGVLYLADSRFLWRVEEGEPEEVCRFSERDYPITVLYTMTSLENGGLLLRIQCSQEKELLLRIEGNQEPLPEKQEVVVASHLNDHALDIAVGEFNRMSEKYKVTIQCAQDSSGETPMDEFWRKQQMEISAGRGPDLILLVPSALAMNIPALAEEGCLQSLEGVLKDEEDFWPAAMEAGKIGGVQYGLPYYADLRLTTYSKDFTGERTSYTLPELMEAVRESGAEVLQWRYDGTDIVLYYGLYDNDNRDFIDWETGESHLKEESFREFLEFAREYADDSEMAGPLDFDTLKQEVAEGKIFSVDNFLVVNWGTIWGEGSEDSLKTIFQGKPACIGYPRSEGNGIYVNPEMFYMNANSDKREGVEEFLRFLLSRENQRLFLSEIILGSTGEPPRMPVRLSVLEESIEMAVEMKEKGAAGNELDPALTEDEAKEARFLIENARPANWKVSEIEDIFYEELPLYFEGKRSLDETVEILDNRVQLYLNE